MGFFSFTTATSALLLLRACAWDGELEELEKLLCKVVENPGIGAVCKEAATLLPQSEATCELFFDEACTEVAKLAPQTGLEARSQLLLKVFWEKLCEVAKLPQVEHRAVDTACAAITKAFPQVKFNPDCKTVLEEAWEAAEALCPATQVAQAAAGLDPKDIEKLLCEIASTPGVEDRAVEQACAAATKLFPEIIKVEDCKTLLEEAWEGILTLCPHTEAKEEEEERAPEPKQIEKLLCELASKPRVEQLTVQAVCTEAAKEFKVSKAKCETLLRGIWDEALAHCPTTTAAAPEESLLLEENTAMAVAARDADSEHEPDPKEIEKLLCELAANPTIEHDAVGVVCAEVKKVFPSLHFDPDCETVMNGIWAQALARCPKEKADEERVPTPKEIEEVICELASRPQVEQIAVNAICAELVKAYPSKILFAECKILFAECKITSNQRFCCTEPSELPD